MLHQNQFSKTFQILINGAMSLELGIETKLIFFIIIKFCQNLVWTRPHVHMPTGMPDSVELGFFQRIFGQKQQLLLPKSLQNPSSTECTYRFMQWWKLRNYISNTLAHFIGLSQYIVLRLNLYQLKLPKNYPKKILTILSICTEYIAFLMQASLKLHKLFQFIIQRRRLSLSVSRTKGCNAHAFLCATYSRGPVK